MIILGVDPGSVTTGFGIIRNEKSRVSHVTSGIVRTSTNYSQSKRLWEIYRKLDLVIREHCPEIMVVESLFHARNSQSLMKLSQVRGVILLLGETHGMEINEYSPMEIKKGVTGYGRAEKHQMVYMIKRLLSLPQLKSPDEADALAMALYHSHACNANGGLR